MKTIGLVGGTSWVSTVDYYRFINEEVNARLGALNFAKLLIYSFNYEEIAQNNARNDWDSTQKLVAEAALKLQTGGAEAILLCANTMHLIAEGVQAQLNIPIIHIADVTAAAIRKDKLTKIGLLGTRFTMERDFFKDKLKVNGIEPLIPNVEERNYIHQTLHDELGKGIIRQETKEHYLAIMKQLIDDGAEGIILGCTEIPLLIKQADMDIPMYDTTYLHSMAAVDFILG